MRPQSKLDKLARENSAEASLGPSTGIETSLRFLTGLPERLRRLGRS